MIIRRGQTLAIDFDINAGTPFSPNFHIGFLR